MIDMTDPAIKMLEEAVKEARMKLDTYLDEHRIRLAFGVMADIFDLEAGLKKIRRFQQTEDEQILDMKAESKIATKLRNELAKTSKGHSHVRN